MYGKITSLQGDYATRVAEGLLRPDPAQEAALAPLQTLLDQITREMEGRRHRLIAWFERRHRQRAGNVSGVYLYGDVGRGKSLLMDLFFARAPLAQKRRVHFHAFMLETHETLHRYQEEAQGDAVIPRLAKDIAAETQLLCFDEFHVGNIADAMILGRLFEALFHRGVRIVATSNWAPEDLYKNGLQRDRFLPFIALLKQRMAVHRIEGRDDHRRHDVMGMDGVFLPLGAATTAKLDEIFQLLTKAALLEERALPIQGRVLRLSRTARGVAFTTFDEVCGKPLGAADYLALAECFQTVIMDGVPELTPEKRNEAARFITFIDVLYEAKTKFFMGCAAPPEKLCASPDNAFAWERTLSRLMEMQTEAYRAQPHLG